MATPNDARELAGLERIARQHGTGLTVEDFLKEFSKPQLRQLLSQLHSNRDFAGMIVNLANKEGAQVAGFDWKAAQARSVHFVSLVENELDRRNDTDEV